MAARVESAYDALGVAPEAAPEAVRAADLRAVARAHPDRARALSVSVARALDGQPHASAGILRGWRFVTTRCHLCAGRHAGAV